MNESWEVLASLALTALKALLATLTKAKAPQEIIDSIQNAINEVAKVHGTIVTKAQVDSITLDYQW